MNHANNGARVSPAECGEPSGVPKGNSNSDAKLRTQRRESLNAKMDRVRQAAKRQPTLQFTTLWHHVYDHDRLRVSFYELRRNGAIGVDGVNWREYEQDLEKNLADLSSRLERGSYRAQCIRRVHIPKGDGRTRPIGILTLEDKLVQRATATVLNAIYEEDFVDWSYGFRPGRSQHQALDALAVAIERDKVNWVLDADIRAFFDSIDQELLIKCLEGRIADTRVIRHIKKWLHAGVLEDGVVADSDLGTPQGGSISPLLGNIYLHYAFDNWAEKWRRQHARGEIHIVRFADDVVVGFQYEDDAERFKQEMQERLAKCHLEVNPEKTRLIRFGRWAAQNRQQRKEGKPETFNFLGFTHICGKTREGKFCVLRKSQRKKLISRLKELAGELRRRIVQPMEEVGKWLKTVLQGHYQYYAVPRNMPSLVWFRDQLTYIWKSNFHVAHIRAM